MSKKGNICVIMADITEDYRDEYLMGVAKQAERMDYVTTVFSMSLFNQLKTCGEEAVFDLIDYYIQGDILDYLLCIKACHTIRTASRL